MSIYYFIFVWIAVMAFLSRIKNIKTKLVVCGQEVYRWKMQFAIIAFLPIIYLVAFTNPRSDTVIYLNIYRNMPTSLEYLLYDIVTSESGQGFTIFEWIIKNISGGSEIVFRVALALLHSIPVLYVFRKYSRDYILSLYLFIATGCHVAWMMNGLRQFMAVAIIMAATPLLLKKKFISLVCVVLLATTVHSSAILMFPVVFIVQGKPWNARTMGFIGIAIVMMYVFSQNTGLMDSMLENTEYAGVMANAAKMGDDGTNPIRVLVGSIPTLLAFVGRKFIDQDNNPVINLCVNMSVITTGLYLVSMVTSGVMVGRLPIYTSLYSYILMPYLITRIFKKESAQMVTVAMLALYFLYYLYAYAAF